MFLNQFSELKAIFHIRPFSDRRFGYTDTQLDENDKSMKYWLMLKNNGLILTFMTSREPLKIAIYLERKISLARTKLGSRHARTKGWVAKYTTLLKLPLHDLFLVAASPYR